MPAFDFDRLLRAARRQWMVVAFALVIFFGIGILYTMTAVPRYTASAQVLLDRISTKVADQYSIGLTAGQDDVTTQSQVELMRSERIAERVIDKLGLADDPDFISPPESQLQQFVDRGTNLLGETGWFPVDTPPQPNEVAVRRAALLRLTDGVFVSRLQGTYVLSLSFTDYDPSRAASIANAWIDAYLTNQLEVKYDATRRASDWLGERIAELRQQSLDADLAIQKYRSENNLISTQGSLVADQRMADANQQLLAARQATGVAKERYRQLTEILENGDMDRAIRESLDSGITNMLRTRYLDSLKQYTALLERLGPDHDQVRRWASEMEENRRLMFEELRRIAQTVRSDLELAQSREKTVEESVAAATKENDEANRKLVHLRELEAAAENARSLFQSFQQRHQEALQQQEFPVSEAIVMSRAAVPLLPSYPNKRNMVAQFLLLGLIAGAAVSAFREYRDRSLRTGEQVRHEIGLKYIGFTPRVSVSTTPDAKRETHDLHRRMVSKQFTIFNHVVDHPLSGFAETMRAAKVAADMLLGDQRPKVIGVISCFPGEGKSTISANFAEMLAIQGERTLLIDGDLRRPGLTKAIARHAEQGIVEAVLDGQPLKELILTNPDTGLHMLPATIRRRGPHMAKLLSNEGMSKLLAECSGSYDYVIVDLPPLAPVVDAAAFAPNIDAFIFVVKWGETARSTIRSILADEPAIASRCLGIIINNADTRKMKYYQEYGSKDYEYDNYSYYYLNDAR